MLIGKVVETFEIKGRGVVVATDTTYEQLPNELRLKIGDPLELRLNGKVVLSTNVAGIEHCDPWSPKHNFAFLIPRDLTKADVPIGSEVWAVV